MMSDDKTKIDSKITVKGEITSKSQDESEVSTRSQSGVRDGDNTCTSDTNVTTLSTPETSEDQLSKPLPLKDTSNASFRPVTISAGAPIFSGRNLHYHPYHNAIRQPYFVSVPPPQAPKGPSISGAVPLPYNILANQTSTPMTVQRFSTPPDFRHQNLSAHMTGPVAVNVPFVLPPQNSSFNMNLPQAASPPTQRFMLFANPKKMDDSLRAQEQSTLHEQQMSVQIMEEYSSSASRPSTNEGLAQRKTDSDASTHPIGAFSAPIIAQEDNSSICQQPPHWNQHDSQSKSMPAFVGPTTYPHFIFPPDSKFVMNYAAGYGSNPFDSNNLAYPTHAIGGGPEQHSECSSYKSRRKKHSSSSETVSSSKTETPPNAHHFLLPAKEAKKLLSNLTWQEKSVYVARHFLGGRTINGFLQATSMARRYKKRRARQLTRHAYSGGKSNIDFTEVEKLLTEESEDQTSSDSKITDDATEEVLKKITMNEYMARRLVAEMAFGITYCETLASTIESILEEISPYKREAMVLEEDASKVSTPCREYNVESLPSDRSAKSVIMVDTSLEKLKETCSLAPQQVLATTIRLAQEDRRPGSSSLSTLRSVRDKKRRKIEYPPLLEGLQSILSISNKKEKMHRIFSINRFRPLAVGDYVAVRPSSQEVWILSRIVTEWQLPSLVSLLELVDMSIPKRDSIFSLNKVQVQDYEEYGSIAPSTIKSLSRSAVLPLSSGITEGNRWSAFLLKGARVYAMYPSTTAFYPATVIDSTTYCQGDHDIVVVEFDGDEDEFNIKAHKHIPSRFITLIPSEFESSTI